MATASLKTTFGGGNFFPTFFSGTQTIASGVFGTLVTITAPAGKKVRLYGLMPLGADESLITISTSYGTVVNNLTLTRGSTNAAGLFNVGYNASVGGASDSAMGVPFIESQDVITISKAGTTSSIISYSFAYGD